VFTEFVYKSNLFFALIFFGVLFLNLDNGRAEAEAFFQISLPLPSTLSYENPWIPQGLVPDRESFVQWKNVASLEVGESPWGLSRRSVDCEDTTLYPTHPSMSLKKYNFIYIGKYQVTRLDRSSPACRVASPMKSNMKCIAPDDLYHYLLSDTYRDRCGNFYRGFVRKVFFKKMEKMETLFSPGRSLIKTPGSPIPGDYTIQSTRAVLAQDFLFLTSLFENDKARMQIEIQSIEKSREFRFDPSNLLYERNDKVNPNR
jgi:hypothetical protein